MTTGSGTQAAAPGRWLYGPVLDLLLGCGAGYLILVAAFFASGLEAKSLPILGLIPLVSIFTGTPHYGATLLRVYERREDRQAYTVFAVWITALVWGLFYLGLYSGLLGSLLLTLYLSWSPWHYAGQNYGIAVMFLRRRGVPLPALAKRVLYLSFLLSYVLALLALHGVQESEAYAAVLPYREGTFQLMRIGIPSPWWEILFVGVGLVYVGTLVASAVLLTRGTRARELAPVAVLALTQMIWFAIPSAARHWDWMGDGALLDTSLTAYAFFWAATGHSVQYVWITSYYAVGNGGGARRMWGYLGKTLIAGSFIWSVPSLLYSLSVEGSRLGGVARDQDVFVLLAAVVNLHHFILDGAIWKLRDGRVARILLRRGTAAGDAGSTGPEAIGPKGHGWWGRIALGLGALATLQVLASLAERQLRFEPALRRGDMAGVYRSVGRLDRIRADSARDYLKLARLAESQRNVLAARSSYERSIAKQPMVASHVGLGRIFEAEGDYASAAEQFRLALAIAPNHPTALYQLGVASLALGEAEEALRLLTRAAELEPGNDFVERELARARSAVEDGGAR